MAEEVLTPNAPGWWRARVIGGSQWYRMQVVLVDGQFEVVQLQSGKSRPLAEHACIEWGGRAS